MRGIGASWLDLCSPIEGLLPAGLFPGRRRGEPGSPRVSVLGEREERTQLFVSDVSASQLSEQIATRSDASANPSSHLMPLPIAAATNRLAKRQGVPKTSIQRLASLAATSTAEAVTRCRLVAAGSSATATAAVLTSLSLASG